MRSSPDSTRRRVVWTAGVLVVVIALAVIGYRWATAPATWPPELDPARSEALLADPERPTAEDLEVLDELITDIALRDPVVIALLDGQPWPAPEIHPVFWTQDGAEARSIVIGGGFRLSLEDATYVGAWPSAGCSDGRYRGKVRSIDAVGLNEVDVVVDLTFERVTHLSTPPPIAAAGAGAGDAGAPLIHFAEDLPDAPWYTGTCPRFDFDQG